MLDPVNASPRLAVRTGKVRWCEIQDDKHAAGTRRENTRSRENLTLQRVPWPHAETINKSIQEALFSSSPQGSEQPQQFRSILAEFLRNHLLMLLHAQGVPS